MGKQEEGNKPKRTVLDRLSGMSKEELAQTLQRMNLPRSAGVKDVEERVKTINRTSGQN